MRSNDCDSPQNNDKHHNIIVNGIIGPLILMLIQAIFDEVPQARLGEVSMSGDQFTILVPKNDRSKVDSVVAKAAAAFEKRFFCSRIDTKWSTVSTDLSTKRREALGILLPQVSDCPLRIDGRTIDRPIVKQKKKRVILDSEDELDVAASDTILEGGNTSDTELQLGFDNPDEYLLSGAGAEILVDDIDVPASTPTSTDYADDMSSSEPEGDGSCQFCLCTKLPNDDKEAFASYFKKFINQVRVKKAEEFYEEDVLTHGEVWRDQSSKVAQNKPRIMETLIRIFQYFSHVAVGHFVTGNGKKDLPHGIDMGSAIELKTGSFYPRAVALPHDFHENHTSSGRLNVKLKLQSAINRNVWESFEPPLTMAQLSGHFFAILKLARVQYRELTKEMLEVADLRIMDAAFIPDYMLKYPRHAF